VAESPTANLIATLKRNGNERRAQGPEGLLYPWGDKHLRRCPDYAKRWEAGDGARLAVARCLWALQRRRQRPEWCAGGGWYDDGYYGHSPERNQQGPSSGTRRVREDGCGDIIIKVSARRRVPAFGQSFKRRDYGSESRTFNCVSRRDSLLSVTQIPEYNFAGLHAASRARIRFMLDGGMRHSSTALRLIAVLVTMVATTAAQQGPKPPDLPDAPRGKTGKHRTENAKIHFNTTIEFSSGGRFFFPIVPQQRLTEQQRSSNSPSSSPSRFCTR